MQSRLKFGRSLNPPTIAINVGDLLDEMYIFNKDRRRKGMMELNHAEYIKFVYGMNVFDWLRRSVDRLDYYKRFAKCNNNVKMHENKLLRVA